MKKTIILSLICVMLFASCKKEDAKNQIVYYQISKPASKVGWKGYLREGNNYGTFSVNNEYLYREWYSYGRLFHHAHLVG
ncbi:MAG: hypothetical protein EOO88_13875 [Pedobacter sp.]|nr:MAG: hypothetical protein EOO88_13875 [Pedobacter sp.]